MQPHSRTLTCGHIIVWGIGEAQQQIRPLAAQLIGLVLGLQLHLCRTRGEAAHEACTSTTATCHQQQHAAVMANTN